MMRLVPGIQLTSPGWIRLKGLGTAGAASKCGNLEHCELTKPSVTALLLVLLEVCTPMWTCSWKCTHHCGRAFGWNCVTSVNTPCLCSCSFFHSVSLGGGPVVCRVCVCHSGPWGWEDGPHPWESLSWMLAVKPQLSQTTGVLVLHLSGLLQVPRLPVL